MMPFLLVAEASPVAGLAISIIVGAVSLLMIFGGRQMIKTKSAGARKLEKLWADKNGQVHGWMAVVKGYILMIGGVVLLLMCIVIFFLSIYIFIFGPINLNG